MLRGRSKMRLRRLMSGDRQKAHCVSKSWKYTMQSFCAERAFWGEAPFGRLRHFAPKAH